MPLELEHIPMRRLFLQLEHLLIQHVFMLVALAAVCIVALVVIVPSSAVLPIGIFLVVFGLCEAAAHRPIAWLMFRFGRITHLNTLSWGQQGEAGARAWYFGLGLTLAVVGVIYLARASIWLL